MRKVICGFLVAVLLLSVIVLISGTAFADQKNVSVSASIAQSDNKFSMSSSDKVKTFRYGKGARVTVRFGNEFQHPDQPYVVIFCKVRKRDRDRFLSALSELNRKMILCGYPGYEEFCTSFIAKMNDGAKTLLEKRCKPNEAHPIGETEQACSERAS